MLINFRNALMSGKRLPYDAEVEYLESTGTQWINTGVKVYNDTNVEITVKVNTQSEVAFIGSATPTDRFVIRSNSGSLSYGFGGWWSNTTATLYNQWRTLRTDVSVPTVYCDGTSYPTTNTPSAKSGTDSILIFDSFRANRGDVAVAGVKIWRGSTLVFDGIPVRRGTIGYLYDRVSGKLFGNAGTGDFVLGPDVVPVEYIESHGAEYIDTGVKVSNSLVSKISFMALTDTSSVYLGALSNNHRYHIARADFGLDSYVSYSSGNVPNGIACNIELNAAEWFCIKDGIKDNGGSATVLPTDRTVCVFARNTGTSVDRLATMRLFSLEMSDATSNLRNYKPIRVGTGSTWEGAMMDVLTRRIYRNAGTGAFGYGNDLKYPIQAS